MGWKEDIKKNKSGFIVTYIVLFLFWIVVSGAYDLQHILFGLVLALLVAVFSRDLFIQSSERAIPRLKTVVLTLAYLVFLVKEIIKSNIAVARIVLSPKISISPGIVKFKTPLKKDIFKVFLANSITLTPGTFTIDIIGDYYYVHAITTFRPEEYIEGVKDWNILLKLKRIEETTE
ncbi:MAG: Na+/H+ antiporter subunit E [Candidatus Hydrothermarchaeales archaeon]